MLYDLSSVTKKNARDLAVLIALTSEAMDARTRGLVRSKFHRECIAASLAAMSPGLAGEVSALAAADQGDVALDKIAVALEGLRASDPAIFMPIPDREQMLQLAIEWRGSPVDDDQRASLRASFCETPEESRMRDAYKFRHETAKRQKQKKGVSAVGISE
ncbi:MAG: hypothetical protein AB7S74_16110 [Hyphomicrobium sp.]